MKTYYEVEYYYLSYDYDVKVYYTLEDAKKAALKWLQDRNCYPQIKMVVNVICE